MSVAIKVYFRTRDIQCRAPESPRDNEPCMIKKLRKKMFEESIIFKKKNPWDLVTLSSRYNLNKWKLQSMSCNYVKVSNASPEYTK